MKDYSGERIWLIGASSGIGEALAKELASRGATLMLSARSETRLRSLTLELEGDHGYKVIDLADIERIPLWIDEVNREWGPIDRVVFLAALYEPTAINDIVIEDLKNMFNVNVCSAITFAQSVIPVLEGRKRGQLAIVSSVAGWIGLPNAQPYGATKAALINFCESLHAEVGDRVDIKLINPGFVDTPLTQKNRFKMPCRLSAGDAAKRLAVGLKSKRFELHFPKRFTYCVKLMKIAPYWLKLRLSRAVRP